MPGMMPEASSRCIWICCKLFQRRSVIKPIWSRSDVYITLIFPISMASWHYILQLVLANKNKQPCVPRPPNVGADEDVIRRKPIEAQLYCLLPGCALSPPVSTSSRVPSGPARGEPTPYIGGPTIGYGRQWLLLIPVCSRMGGGMADITGLDNRGRHV
jgi:hypothetical protein